MAARGPRRSDRARPARSTASSRSTPAAGTAAPSCSARPSAHLSALTAYDVVPGSTTARSPPPSPRPRADAGRRPRRVGLAPPRRRQPRRPTRWPSCWPPPRSTPTPTILGPKLREWPSLRRLLELGVTISGTGRRETGLERGEYDQGQHDEVREVLAVNTAGMLVRRRVLEELGGLRRGAADLRQRHRLRLARRAAGHRTIVVPQAVVFHAEAAHRGLRRTPLTGRHTHYQERRAALFTLLANAAARRLAVAGRPAVLRHAAADARLPAGPLASARPLDELAALLSRLLAGRGQVARRPPGAARSRAGATRPTCAACWRRGGCPTATASTSSATSPPPPTNQAADVAERRRAARRRRRRRRVTPRTASGATSADDEDDASSPTPAWWPGSSPTRWRSCWSLLPCWRSSPPARPSARSPAARCRRCPRPHADWWRLHVESWHPLGHGHRRPRAGVRAAVRPGRQPARSAAPAAVSRADAAGGPVAAWGAWRLLGSSAASSTRRAAPVAARSGAR